MSSTKTLVGVLHDDSDREEMRQVLALVAEPTVSKVGLEITNEYSRTNDCPPFFDRIHDYSKASGRKIVPLEHQIAHERYAAINAAVRVLEGTLSRDDLEFMVQYTTEELRSLWALKSSQIRTLKENQKTAKRALKILDKNPSKEEVTQMYEDVIAEREKHMLSRIKRHNPDLVVIGVAHAEAIRESLPEYQYICLAKRDAEGIFES